MLLIPAGLVAIALPLLILALRGRRIDDHPICRRCRFDLVGLAAAPERCPECGSSLARRRATRAGNRRRSGRLLAGALAMLVAGLAVGGAMIADRAGKFGWNHYKPAWLLAMETRAGATRGGAAAAAELTKRFGGGGIGKDTMLALAGRALAVQADPKASWDPVWGDAIEAAWAAGLLSQEQQESYARHAAAFHFVMRARTRTGDPCAMTPSFLMARSGRRMSFTVDAKIESVTLDGAPLEPPEYEGLSTTIGPNSAVANNTRVAMNAEPGVRKFRVVWNLSALPAGAAAMGGDSPAGVTARWQEAFDVDVAVTPTDVPVVRLVPDESARSDVQRALSAGRLTVNASSGSAPMASGTITIRNAPRDLAFELFCREGAEREWSLGTISVRKASPGQSTQSSFGVSGAMPGFKGGPVDLIFRPSLAAALRTTDLTEVWDGQMVLPAQPVNVNGDLGPP